MYDYALTGVINGYNIKPLFCKTRSKANAKLDKMLASDNLQVEDVYTGTSKHDVVYKCSDYTLFRITRHYK